MRKGLGSIAKTRTYPWLFVKNRYFITVNQVKVATVKLNFLRHIEIKIMSTFTSKLVVKSGPLVKLTPAKTTKIPRL